MFVFKTLACKYFPNLWFSKRIMKGCHPFWTWNAAENHLTDCMCLLSSCRHYTVMLWVHLSQLNKQLKACSETYNTHAFFLFELVKRKCWGGECWCVKRKSGSWTVTLQSWSSFHLCEGQNRKERKGICSVPRRHKSAVCIAVWTLLWGKRYTR